MTLPGTVGGSPRAFAVLPEGQAEPAGLRVVGRVDRFDLGVPIATRMGADVIVLSERLVDADDGWDAVRGIANSTSASIWVLADGGGRNRERWREVAARVVPVGDWSGFDRGASAGAQVPGHDLVVVLGTKGGVGKTFVSANLIHAASAAGITVSAVDLDAETGDLGLRLGMECRIDLSEVGQGKIASVPQEWITAKRGSPVQLMAAVPRPEFASVLDERLTRVLLANTAAIGQCTVVDTPSDQDNPAVCTAIDLASSIVLVSTLNPASVRQAKTTVDLLKRLNIPVRERLVVVINRHSRKAPVDASTFRDLVGYEPRVIIGDIGVAADLEAYYGYPTLASRNRKRVAQPFMELARTVFRVWPSESRVGRHPRVSLFNRRRRQPAEFTNLGRGWM